MNSNLRRTIIIHLYYIIYIMCGECYVKKIRIAMGQKKSQISYSSVKYFRLFVTLKRFQNNLSSYYHWATTQL
jgi:hypothetical protein